MRATTKATNEETGAVSIHGPSAGALPGFVPGLNLCDAALEIGKPTDLPKGFAVSRTGKAHAGKHVIVDLKGAKHLDDIECVRRAFEEAVEAAGATLLHIHLHEFLPSGGITGVAVLAESHISIHTWPECGYAALDVFMCGRCDPHDAIPVLERAFEPDTVEITEFLRGGMDVEARSGPQTS
jgi:S-adenosylmethionine decarboxylase